MESAKARFRVFDVDQTLRVVTTSIDRPRSRPARSRWPRRSGAIGDPRVGGTRDGSRRVARARCLRIRLRVPLQRAEGDEAVPARRRAPCRLDASSALSSNLSRRSRAREACGARLKTDRLRSASRSHSAQTSLMKRRSFRAPQQAEEAPTGMRRRHCAADPRFRVESLGPLGVVDCAQEPRADDLLELVVADSVLPREPLELIAAVESEDDVLARGAQARTRRRREPRGRICSATWRARWGLASHATRTGPRPSRVLRRSSQREKAATRARLTAARPATARIRGHVRGGRGGIARAREPRRAAARNERENAFVAARSS